MKDNGGPAFPRPGGFQMEEAQEGLSLRDYFAGQMLNAMASSDEGVNKVFAIAKDNAAEPSKVAAAMAYEQADAMLEERAKE